MKPELTRRRVLAVIAGMGLAAQGVRAADAPVLEWHGTALGADATLIFASSNKEQAEEALAACLAEVDRLEQIFSLHIDTSEISQLNAHGVLAHPSFDMRALLTQSLRMHRLTGGLFDPTVQAIWDFRRSEVGGNVETVGAIPASVLANVGFEKIAINTDRVALEQGVSITLNGIAQGYITDRVADILHRRGWKNVLIDLGEARVLDGRPFDVVIGENGRKIALSGGALATSSSAPLPVGVSATLPHLFNPRSGAAASRAWSTVSVAHASAAVADGLSTALMLCDGDEAQRARNILSGFPGARAWIVRSDLTEIEIAA